MSNLRILVGGWVALNAALLGLLLVRRPNPHIRHRLFRWTVGGVGDSRPRRSAQALILAHHRHH
jgi:hypothetical protein